MNLLFIHKIKIVRDKVLLSIIKAYTLHRYRGRLKWILPDQSPTRLTPIRKSENYPRAKARQEKG